MKLLLKPAQTFKPFIHCLTRYFSKSHPFSPRIFSGIQPSGIVHLGNYFGAIKRWIELQEGGKDAIYCVVDLHSITVPQVPQQLQQNILEMTATLLACGIDPTKCILFQQSSVRQHSELCWILGTIATMARLSHLPQYKEKSEKFKEIPLGLFIYPILQAADILLYKATHVPVGEDQVQQIQMAQQLVKTFNYRFGITFPAPKALIGENYVARLRNLKDPTKKMSKSEPEVKSRINLNDPPDVLLEKCKKAITDFTSQVTYDPIKRPGVANLITIHSLLTNKTPEQICNENTHLDTGQYKLVLADIVIESLKPIREKITDYMDNQDYLVRILKDGKEKAEVIAENTLQEVKDKVGFNLKKVSVNDKVIVSERS